MAPGDFAIKVKWEGLVCSFTIKNGLERKMSTGKGIIAQLHFPLRFAVNGSNSLSLSDF